ncbi:MAG TPA: adenylate/guanylate cyclase domain-containing protein [Microvirga sp.]|nr:adenylate/guanylate cyclase domain-containing protein [Microvirga sp.]
MQRDYRFRPSLRAVVVAITLASVVPSGLLLHLTWWRTATSVSRNLVDTLETQITDAARRAWWSRVLEVQGLSATLRSALSVTDPHARERILLAASRAAPALSWLVHVREDGEALAVENGQPRIITFHRTDAMGRVRSSARAGSGDARQSGGDDAPVRLAIQGAPWIGEASRWSEPGWADVPGTPDSHERAVAYVDASGGEVLAAMIGYSRFAQLLGEIPVGRTGRIYVLEPDGAIVIAAHADERPRLALLDPVALAAGRRIAARPEQNRNVEEKLRLDVSGQRYAVGLSPLWFQGWQLAAIVPEEEFLGSIETTIRLLGLSLAALVALAGLLGVAAARRLVVEPVARVAQDLGFVERFELDRLPRRRSRVREIDRLSQAIERMGAGLADFAKFIPTELVRSLVAEGMRLEPGGERREITVLFADLAGFTRLSEQLGEEVVPIVSRYLEAASHAVAAEQGTVDKFIGDAVMAFWGAPRSDADQAVHACRAALAIAGALERIALDPAIAATLKVRVGVQSGPAIVGNIGSPTRLNYTALGDTVNLASRLEAVNKIYGTTILIGPATRALAGRRILTREVDRVAVYGKAEGVAIFELLAVDRSGPPPDWVVRYEQALGFYRERRFAEAAAGLGRVLALRSDDGPALRLLAACRRLAADPPPPGWRAVTVLDTK